MRVTWRIIGIMDPHAHLKTDGKAHAVCMEESPMLDGRGISGLPLICPAQVAYRITGYRLQTGSWDGSASEVNSL